MNTPSNAMPESRLQSPAAAPVPKLPVQPFYWSIRRELWENRGIYLAPLVAAGLFLLGFLINIHHLPTKIRAASALDPTKLHELIAEPYNFAELLLMGTALIVSIFYCLDAFYGERRDRSVLFWKSLPVSDLTTVLSKAVVPILILPAITFAISALTEWFIYLFSVAALLANGVPVEILSSHLGLWQRWVGLFFHLVGVHGLWYAPFYGWMLLVSAWARRAPLLWAVLPPFAIAILEKITFNTSHFAALLLYRFSGGPEGAKYASGAMSMDPLSHLAPGHFFMSSGLWFGFAFAAICLAAAVRLRRYRDPI